MSVEAKLSRLSIDLKHSQSPDSPHLANSAEPPDSWEDEANDDYDDTPVEAPGPTLKPITSMDEAPAPPPPTPISPLNTRHDWNSSSSLTSDGRPSSRYSTASHDSSSDRRPEKTTSTASRMIAGALGIKAPKKTEEQKQYDRAMKEAEIRRKNREKEVKEKERLDDEQAKASVWDS